MAEQTSTHLSGKMTHAFDLPPEQLAKLLLHGKFRSKVDGSNGAIGINNGEITVYRRRDDKKALAGRMAKKQKNKKMIDPDNLPDGYVNMPAGPNPRAYTSKNRETGEAIMEHNYFYIKMNPNGKNSEDRAARKILELVEANLERVMKHAQPKEPGSEELFLTVELIGQPFCATPGMEGRVGFAIHAEQTYEPPERTVEAIKKHLTEEVTVEGLVLVDDDGVYYKILSEHMGDGPGNHKLRKSGQTDGLPPAVEHTFIDCEYDYRSKN